MEFILQSDSNCHSAQQPEQNQISVHFLCLSPHIFNIDINIGGVSVYWD